MNGEGSHSIGHDKPTNLTPCFDYDRELWTRVLCAAHKLYGSKHSYISTLCTPMLLLCNMFPMCRYMMPV